MDFLNTNTNEKTLILVTQDHTGSGWGKIAFDLGYRVIVAYKKRDTDKGKDRDYLRVGAGIYTKIELEKLMKVRSKFKNALWLWDANHNFEEGELLRKEGFKNILGGMKLTYDMEKDRKFGTDIITKAGLKTPETHEFSDIAAGMEFIESRPDEAWVFKPDDGEGSWTTFVPNSPGDAKANLELLDYMETQNKAGTYILQKRIKGVEANFEVWLHDGKPVYAFCDLECKRKYAHDEGELTGCSHDIAFSVPLDCKGVSETVAKLYPQFKHYTGFLDMNIICCDGDYYFLEFCARFGYNSHPNLFLTLAKRPFTDILSDLIAGRTENFYENFRDGFGSSITMYIDHPMPKFPIFISEDVEDKFFHFDTYRDRDKYRLAGYSQEVGIVCGYEFTVLDAAKEAIRNYEKINFPCRAGRLDQDRVDYPLNPQSRYNALVAMKMFETKK